jgi:hypothetical protein
VRLFKHPPKTIADSLRKLMQATFRSLTISDKSVMDRLAELDKRLGDPSWTIETCLAADHHESEDSTPILRTWQNSTIEWLMNPKLFCPQQLPKLHPRHEIRGTFETATKYLDESSQLWTGMTWYNGWAALTPACRFLFIPIPLY